MTGGLSPVCASCFFTTGYFLFHPLSLNCILLGSHFLVSPTHTYPVYCSRSIFTSTSASNPVCCFNVCLSGSGSFRINSTQLLSYPLHSTTQLNSTLFLFRRAHIYPISSFNNLVPRDKLELLVYIEILLLSQRPAVTPFGISSKFFFKFFMSYLLSYILFILGIIISTLNFFYMRTYITNFSEGS